MSLGRPGWGIPRSPGASALPAVCRVPESAKEFGRHQEYYQAYIIPLPQGTAKLGKQQTLKLHARLQEVPNRLVASAGKPMPACGAYVRAHCMDRSTP